MRVTLLVNVWLGHRPAECTQVAPRQVKWSPALAVGQVIEPVVTPQRATHQWCKEFSMGPASYAVGVPNAAVRQQLWDGTSRAAGPGVVVFDAKLKTSASDGEKKDCKDVGRCQNVDEDNEDGKDSDYDEDDESVPAEEEVK